MFCGRKSLMEPMGKSTLSCSREPACTFFKSCSTLLYTLSVIQVVIFVALASLQLIPSYSGSIKQRASITATTTATTLAPTTTAVETTNKSDDSLWRKVFLNKAEVVLSTKAPSPANVTEVKCSYNLNDLKLKGPMDITFDDEPPSMEELNKMYPNVSNGGSYKPKHCLSLHKVAIIVPYRNRELHLRYFLFYMHPFLMRQNLDYKIYIINQHGNGTFNRAKLLNVGFIESLSDYDFQCFTFHDVDLIPEDDRILYTCPSSPRHLSRGVDKFKYKLPYVGLFGGAVQLKKEHFIKVNGFSNTFWGWGGEDDEFSRRLQVSRLPKLRYPADIAKYKMIQHKHEKGNEVNPDRYNKLQKAFYQMHKDGLSTLSYWVVEKTEYQLYTNVTVELFGPR